MGGRVSWCILALAALVGSMPVGSAGAASLLELNFWLSGPRYEGVLPPCDAETALHTIASRFSQKEGRYWNSELTIAGYQNIREVAYRPGPPNTIPRRYCSGVALISDGVKRPVYYSIGETTGIIGATWGVEWCVVGLDRNLAYAPNCKMARP